MLAGLAGPAAADAAVTTGPSVTAPLNGSNGCSPCTAVNLTNSSAQLTSPIDGVVVRYRLQKSFVGADFGTVSLHVLRPAGSGAFTGVGTSVGVPTAGLPVLRESPAQIPIHAGDYIGIDVTGPDFDYRNAAAGSSFGVFTGGLADGSPPTAPSYIEVSEEIPLQADIEPDADSDGFGDETQDQCPNQTGSENGCDRTAPDTTITATPPNVVKTKKKKATVSFSFTSTEANSSFQCKLDGGAFAPCGSPFTTAASAKRKKPVDHTFTVFAVDSAGNPDASPATYDFKVKRKKKKHHH